MHTIQPSRQDETLDNESHVEDYRCPAALLREGFLGGPEGLVTIKPSPSASRTPSLSLPLLSLDLSCLLPLMLSRRSQAFYCSLYIP